MEEEEEIKAIFLGESGVGKTCLINRYFFGKMGDSNPTISPSYNQKTIKLHEKNYMYTIWDTAGKELFRSLNKIFLNDSKIVVLVYDITDKNSFLNLQIWLDMVIEKLGADIYLILVGNKSDLYMNKKIKQAKGEEFAEIIKARFIMTSAKDDYLQFNNFLEDVIGDYIKNYEIKKNW